MKKNLTSLVSYLKRKKKKLKHPGHYHILEVKESDWVKKK